jgi:hypothetical protein
MEDKSLNVLAQRLSPEQGRNLGIELEVTSSQIEHFRISAGSDTAKANFDILRTWREKQGDNPNTRELIQALRECELNSIADAVHRASDANTLLRMNSFK